ncbi:hypothetical protein SDC9_200895 [bioreactor metagenome]|uniref:Uncharacterized protein n=1 Tax=bioreactor metagenome TaxID=1076179 RepID=A0A645IPI0_9ZZZZ
MNHANRDRCNFLIIPMTIQHLGACDICKILRLAEFQSLFHRLIHCFIRRKVRLNWLNIFSGFLRSFNRLLYTFRKHVPSRYLISAFCRKDCSRRSNPAGCSCDDNSRSFRCCPPAKNNLRFLIILCHFQILLSYFLLP